MHVKIHRKRLISKELVMAEYEYKKIIPFNYLAGYLTVNQAFSLCFLGAIARTMPGL